MVNFFALLFLMWLFGIPFTMWTVLAAFLLATVSMEIKL